MYCDPNALHQLVIRHFMIMLICAYQHNGTCLQCHHTQDDKLWLLCKYVIIHLWSWWVVDTMTIIVLQASTLFYEFTASNWLKITIDNLILNKALAFKSSIGLRAAGVKAGRVYLCRVAGNTGDAIWPVTPCVLLRAIQGGPKKVSLRSLHITSSNTDRFS